jgi:GNAT superfamily N-acetyltransferase
MANSSEASRTADPQIVEAWATGWALSRGTPAPVRAAGAFRIDVGLPQHKARYVSPQCSHDVQRLAETIHDPEVFIKVCAPPEPVQSQLPTHWMIERLGFMMTHVYDQIQTHEQHRRRGLGRVVMNALRQTASKHGGYHGLLVATPDGHALYSTLGWQMHSLYTTAAIDSTCGY